MKEVIIVDKSGRVTLPYWAWSALLKMSGIRSKKRRLIKKAVKKELHRLIINVLKEK